LRAISHPVALKQLSVSEGRQRLTKRGDAAAQTEENATS
jgi:hypothetical protein